MTVLLNATAAAVPNGAEFTVPANTAFVLSVYTAVDVFPSNVDGISLDIKTDNAQYTYVDQLGGGRPLVAVLPPVASAITYRLRKNATSVVMGVDGR